MSEPVWRPIPSCPGYEAASDGSIRSVKRGVGRPKVLHVDKEGYLQFTNHQDGAVKRRAVHTAVAEAHLGPRPTGTHVRHLNGDQVDNRASNLAYGSPSENAQDQVRHGRHVHARKTHCPQNHPYDETNTYWMGASRYCRACNREAARRLKMRRKADQ